VVEEVLRLLLRVLELRGQDVVVVAALHGGHLLVDDLLVHPGEALLHEGDRARLVHALHVDAHGERDRQVHDLGDAAVHELAAERAEHERLAPGAVDAELVGRAPGLGLDAARAHQVLRPEPRVRREELPVRRDAAARAYEGAHRREARRAVERLDLAPHALERLGDLAADPRESRGTADSTSRAPTA
jgi:hypothetical protein